jgi:SCP1.201-like deaminase
MSVEQVGQQLARVRELLPLAVLADAADALGWAAQAIREAAAGSSNPEPEEIAQAWEAAGTTARDLIELLRHVDGLIVQYQRRLGAPGNAPPPTPGSGNQQGRAAPRPGASNLTDAQVDEIMKKLPERSDTNRKTTGRWIGAEGRERGPVNSGRDDDSCHAAEVLQKLGIGPVRGSLLSTEHVEVKLAARLRDATHKHVSVVINNTPCGGRYSCDRLLPQILKVGQALTLHWPGGKKTYNGKGT